MKSVVLIVPYIGKWPLWFEAHLVSIAQNPTIDWLFITDCKIPKKYPDNVRFVPTTVEMLNSKINNILEVRLPLSPRKLCDVRPAYGKVFQEYITAYDFWGFCDVDIIWGDLRKFLSNAVLSNNDVISSRKNTVSGHFTILQNTAAINSLYKSIPNYLEMLSVEPLMRIDEEAFTELLKDPKIFSKLTIWWETYLMNQENGKAHQEYYLDKWIWKEGKVLELKNGKPVEEVMYLHFINWKRTITFSDIKYIDNPKQFYISSNGMHYKPHSSFTKAIHGLKNLFDGYHIRESRRLKRKKVNSLLKRIKQKIKNV